MKIACLTTSTNNTIPLYEPLRVLGNALTVIAYDPMTYKEQESLPEEIEKLAPDWVLFIGALYEHSGLRVPNIEILAKIGAKFPLVHLCCDGAEPVWWKQIEDFYDSGRFALQVNIDGVRTGPIGERGLTTICPIDATQFANPPWGRRSILCGFGGGLHGGRTDIVYPLVARGKLTYRDRHQTGPHSDYIEFLESCKIGLNIAHTGGGTGGDHVKLRAGGELPAAGCLVLETKGSPLGDWFDTGKDFLEYDGVNDAVEKIAWVKANLEEAESIARRMRAKVIERYNPAVFWSQVMERLGFGEALIPVQEATYKYWRPTSAQTPALAVTRVWPEIVEEHPRANVVGWEGRYYMIPLKMGEVDVREVAGEVFSSADRSEASKKAAAYG